jgi:hypothetical protein
MPRRFLARVERYRYDLGVKALLAIVCATGCSFFGVRATTWTRSEPAPNPAALDCTDSDTLPAIDAIGGAAALAGAGGGFIIEQTQDNELHNFTKYYLGPLVAVAIVYFIATSYGTNRVEGCRAAKGEGISEEQ